MKTTIYYLFDPLCGWCYGATPSLSSMDNAPDIKIELLPTGLFSGEGARPMDADFAAFAWSNDQRIAHLTGQSFSERYLEVVLGNREQLFDSGAATIALTAVSLTAQTQELDALKAIQHARFVDGSDITNWHTLSSILKGIGLDDAASMIQSPDAVLLNANSTRTTRAQILMREFNARGVPTFIASSGTKRWMLHTNEIYSNSDALISQLKLA